MPSLCGVFTVQIVLTERKTKDKSYYFFFPQLLKIMAKKKKSLETFESEKGKVYSSDFQERSY